MGIVDSAAPFGLPLHCSEAPHRTDLVFPAMDRNLAGNVTPDDDGGVSEQRLWCCWVIPPAAAARDTTGSLTSESASLASTCSVTCFRGAADGSGGFGVGGPPYSVPTSTKLAGGGWILVEALDEPIFLAVSAPRTRCVPWRPI
jgi:hypothetical protein